jgi:hypothetical protein
MLLNYFTFLFYFFFFLFLCSSFPLLLFLFFFFLNRQRAFEERNKHIRAAVRSEQDDPNKDLTFRPHISPASEELLQNTPIAKETMEERIKRLAFVDPDTRRQKQEERERVMVDEFKKKSFPTLNQRSEEIVKENMV